MKAEPTGPCWCGCGETTGKYFHKGCDRKVEKALLEIIYGRGSIADVLAMLGYGPEHSVTAARDRLLEA